MKLSTLTLMATLTAGFSSIASAAKFEIDPGHSSVIFKVPHGKNGLVVGRFNTLEGFFEIDNEKENSGKANITIDATSIDTNHEARDKHVRSNDFLSVKEFPEITFVASNYKGDMKKGKLTGDLSLHGVTKNITLDVALIGHQQVPEKYLDKVPFVSISGYTATADFKPADFGIGEGEDRVTIEIAVEAHEPKS